jgi:hypothetical protein
MMQTPTTAQLERQIRDAEAALRHPDVPPDVAQYARGLRSIARACLSLYRMFSGPAAASPSTDHLRRDLAEVNALVADPDMPAEFRQGVTQFQRWLVWELRGREEQAPTVH